VSARQLKVGLRVSDLERSATLYRQLGFPTIPDDPRRGPARPPYLAYGHTWLILSDRFANGYHEAGREALARSGPLGAGFVLVVPTADLGAVRELWRREGLPVTLEPEDVGFARVFHGLDPDGYEIMFEEFAVR
jgi:lactoylglutathione lyase